MSKGLELAGTVYVGRGDVGVLGALADATERVKSYRGRMEIRKEKAVERGSRRSHKGGASGGEGRVRTVLGEDGRSAASEQSAKRHLCIRLSGVGWHVLCEKLND